MRSRALHGRAPRSLAERHERERALASAGKRSAPTNEPCELRARSRKPNDYKWQIFALPATRFFIAAPAAASGLFRGVFRLAVGRPAAASERASLRSARLTCATCAAALARWSRKEISSDAAAANCCGSPTRTAAAAAEACTRAAPEPAEGAQRRGLAHLKCAMSTLIPRSKSRPTDFKFSIYLSLTRTRTRTRCSSARARPLRVLSTLEKGAARSIRRPPVCRTRGRADRFGHTIARAHSTRSDNK